MAKLVLTVVSDDRPGLVAQLSDVVAEHGGNWLGSQLSGLAGKFAGVVLIDMPADAVAGLVASTKSLAEQGLQITVSPVDVEATPAETQLRLHVVGSDRPGIVRELSVALANNHVAINELITSAYDAPMAGGALFEADAQLSVPGGVDLDAVRTGLEAIATELMIDLDVDDETDNDLQEWGS